MGVAQAAVHVLARKRRRQMCGVTGQKHPPQAPLFGEARVEGIDLHPAQAGVFVGASLGQKRPHEGLLHHLRRVLPLVQHEFMAPDAIRPRQADRRPPWVAAHLGMAASVRGLMDIDDQPGLFEGGPLHLQPQGLPV